MNRLLEFVGLVMFAWLLVLAFAWTCAHAAFQPGIVNPTPIAAADSAALGSTVQRYHLQWKGEPTYTGSLALARGTRPVVSVDGSLADPAAFCRWTLSLLNRYPAVHDVILGNEVSPSNRARYVALLRHCAPKLHARGVRVIGPGLHPAGPVSYLWPLVDAIAAAGPHLLDALDFHPFWYSSASYDTAVIRHARSVFGWQIPVWITEDGMQSQPAPQFARLYSGIESAQASSEAVQAQRESQMMRDAYCSGASVWLSFLLRDEPQLNRWQSGLARPDGSHKPAWAAFRATAAAIRTGKVNCATPAPPIPAQKPKTRRAQASHRYLCAQAYKGAELPATRRNIMRGVCVVAGG